MHKRLFQYLKKDEKKYLLFIFLILLILAASAIILPKYVSYIVANRTSFQNTETARIEKEAVAIYKRQETKVIKAGEDVKQKLLRALRTANNSYGGIVKVLNSERFDNYSVEIVAPNGKLVAWNDEIAVEQKDIFPLFFPVGNVYFNNSNLVTWLTLVDTLNIDSDQFYVFVSRPFEKYYSIKNSYYKEYSFIKTLNDNFLNQFEADFSPYASFSKDGRKYSFPIVNNKNNKIGVLTYYKPSIQGEIENAQQIVSKIQSLLILTAFLLLGLGLKKDYKNLTRGFYKFLASTLYLIILRIVIYDVGIPAKFISGSITDPANFSSAWGGGIVKSPIEFLITNIFFLIFSISSYIKLKKYISEAKNFNFIKKYYYPLVFMAATIFFWLARGLAAALKSVIIDSSYRYFNETGIIPGVVPFMMSLNTLILSSSIFMLLLSIIFLIVKFYNINNPENNIKLFILFLFLGFELFGIAFILVQKSPLIPAVYSILLVLLIFVLVYHIYINKPGNIYNYAYIALASSIFAIALLNTFNLEIEKESLKKIALDLSRRDENYYQFLINETLDDAVNNSSINNYLNNSKTNLNSSAFIVWSKSILQRESLISSVTIYDNYLKRFGSFNVESEEDSLAIMKLKANKIKDRVFFNSINTFNKREYTGITPVLDGEIILGYVIVKIITDPQSIGFSNLPEFINPRSDDATTAFDLKDIKIMQLVNGKVSRVFGNIFPSKEQVEPIIKATFSADNESWINLPLNNENFLTYLIKSYKDSGESIIAVSLREKQFTWNLFNFFKIFIVHTFFILILIACLFLFSSKKIKFSFRIQLLLAFLTISIIPIIILAVYNREMVTQKSTMSIADELGERLNYLKNFIEYNYKTADSTNSLNVFQNAARELKISFSVYEDANQIYNSKEDYFNAGLFNSKLNPVAYYYLNYLNYQEFLSEEQIEKFTYNSYYKKITINNKNYIMGVNDAFNKVLVPITVNDVDVFLFGVYSLAVIIIIILSTFLANKISMPIRKLTKATDAIAHGDLNIQIDNSERGEIKDLIDGFNLMTSELKKNEMQLAELERENAWKEMAKQVAHEIKNPLTPMKLSMQLLVASYKENTAKFDRIFDKLSSTILNQIESLSQIASEFSRFARMPNYNLEHIDVLPIIYDIKNLFLDEQVKINILSAEKEIEAELDKSQIRRLFINLVRNSIQAKASVINFFINIVDDKCNITIEDNGEGIPEGIRNKIFDPNFTTKEKGMGIGLKLGKRFIEGINGKLELQSSSQKGTAFLITFNIKKVR
ncbi:MAG: ATP-binding protein [Bacteroidota bacterium]|nr:ATP-binding protein [Bacteroidota bacterium]